MIVQILFNSNAMVNLANKLKCSILEVLYYLLTSLNATLYLAIRLKHSILKAIYNRLNSDEALSFIEAFHSLLGELALFPIALTGLHFQVLGVSPLHTHFAIILLFFMAAIVRHIAYLGIKLQPQDAGYLPILRFICLVSGIITIELLFAIIDVPLGSRLDIN
ncbi:hypothetical protein RGQ29_004083 [Quercus rubra]|uniref:Uncharacterized protein n=1 Tax=Quercus rubra TaxID=3512 RepID=A0AAN7EDC0_QUERU|nr:hypothetical protein RGQ29_004083 [Quercus rubra]